MDDNKLTVGRPVPTEVVGVANEVFIGVAILAAKGVAVGIGLLAGTGTVSSSGNRSLLNYGMIDYIQVISMH